MRISWAVTWRNHWYCLAFLLCWTVWMSWTFFAGLLIHATVPLLNCNSTNLFFWWSVLLPSCWIISLLKCDLKELWPSLWHWWTAKISICFQVSECAHLLWSLSEAAVFVCKIVYSMKSCWQAQHLFLFCFFHTLRNQTKFWVFLVWGGDAIEIFLLLMMCQSKLH